MTICELVLKAKIPKDKRYPKILKSLGDHLRTKRLDNNMGIKEVAKIMGVSIQHFVHWEQNNTTPNLSYYSDIITFLGYLPPKIEEHFILTNKLKNYRRENNLSYHNFATRIGINRSGLYKLEKQKMKITKLNRNRILSFFERVDAINIIS